MVDFKKAISKHRYEFVKEHRPDVFAEIVAFSSTFGGSEEIPLSIRAQVEDYCMGVARRMYNLGWEASRS